jgi:hypothetical protein
MRSKNPTALDILLELIASNAIQSAMIGSIGYLFEKHYPFSN